MKRAKLKDIAEAMNLSIATVSKALNDKFDINEKTKQNILRVAQEMNYRPNNLAASLRKKSYDVIGVILPRIEHYFFATVLKGIMNKSHKANYLVLIGETNHEIQKEETIMEQFINHGVTGVIISPSRNSYSSDIFDKFRKKRIPFVLVDRPLMSDRDSYVRYDDSKGAFLACAHLIEQGYKKIALIKAGDDCVISNARYEGYLKAMAQHDLPIQENFVRSCFDFSLDSNDGYLIARQLLSMRDRPDAIFAVTDDLASGAYLAAEEIGLQIPKDIGIVGYSNSNISRHLTPKLTTVEQPGIKMGEEAFDLLQQILIGNTTLFKRVFDARLIIRESSTRNLSLHQD